MLNFKKAGIFSRGTGQEDACEQEEQGGGVLAVWGSPGSGKTTVAVRLAKYLADRRRNVVLLLCDMTAPMLPCICPASELECERSLGSVLAAAHVSEVLVKNNLVTHKRLGYLTMLGMLKGENEYTYKDFSDRHIDAIEIMVGKLYAQWGISDGTNFAGLKPQDYPILSDLYELIEQEYREYDESRHQLYTAELLQEILLGLHSMCQGAEAQFFNGHTNVTSSRFIVFGVKGLLQASKNVRGSMLFNILSYMSDHLLTIGNTTAALDELYVWLSDNVSVGTTIIEYIRNTLKRVRKKESNLIMASQNLEDFDREGIRELTKPLFAIPPHQFIFNCGSIDKRFYMDLLQLEEAEYSLIRFPQRGVCLFKCGNERYLLEVHAPAYKEALFGTAGGR